MAERCKPYWEDEKHSWKWFVPIYGAFSDNKLSNYFGGIFSVPKMAVNMAYHTLTGKVTVLALAKGLEKLLQ